jgi:hypothetical protein
MKPWDDFPFPEIGMAFRLMRRITPLDGRWLAGIPLALYPLSPRAGQGVINMLKFGEGNAKLDKYKVPIVTFSLPAGFTCPGARDCKSRAMEDMNGKRYILDGPDTEFRCFAASQEVLFTNTYNARRHNLELLRKCKTTNEMAKLIADSLPSKSKIVRIHVSGDFFSQKYFDAWVKVATDNPSVVFYAYTKSLPYVIKRRDSIPQNFRLTASYGGRHDSLIPSSGIRSARVVFSEAEADRLGLEIDADDSHAIGVGGDFALILHGVQPKGSEASKALVQIKKRKKKNG